MKYYYFIIFSLFFKFLISKTTKSIDDIYYSDITNSLKLKDITNKNYNFKYNRILSNSIDKDNENDKTIIITQERENELINFKNINTFLLMICIILAYSYIIVKNIKIYIYKRSMSGYNFIPSEDDNSTEMKNLYNDEDNQ